MLSAASLTSRSPLHLLRRASAPSHCQRFSCGGHWRWRPADLVDAAVTASLSRTAEPNMADHAPSFWKRSPLERPKDARSEFRRLYQLSQPPGWAPTTLGSCHLSDHSFGVLRFLCLVLPFPSPTTVVFGPDCARESSWKRFKECERVGPTQTERFQIANSALKVRAPKGTASAPSPRPLQTGPLLPTP